MLRLDESKRSPLEKLLVDAVRDVVSEFLLLDLTELICCVGTNRMKPVETLINSAIELYFKPGCLAFSNTGSVDVSWVGSIKLGLDFEFKRGDVRIYFTVILQPKIATIEINYLCFGDCATQSLSHEQCVIQITAALADARRRPANNRLAWWRDDVRP